MKQIRKIIEIDQEKCDGCGDCVPSCAEGAIQIVDGKAKVIADKYCDGLGACLGECPKGALRIVERRADAFDEQAVHEMLEQKKSEPALTPLACGCPSTQVKTFPMAGSGPCPTGDKPISGTPSALGHWPVQIRLIPPGAPFLKEADLLIAADCVPVAYPAFHRDLLAGKAVMIGCPKFDDPALYVEKLSQIFAQDDIKSITVAVMEVPCCAGLPKIINQAMEKAGVQIPLTTLVISAQGRILS